MIICGIVHSMYVLEKNHSMTKQTSRNMNFVSIHNSLYTQCIGAPIQKKKKTSFFPNFLKLFFKKPQNFLHKAKRDFCTETSNNRIPHQQHSKTPAAQFHIISEAK